MTQLQGVSVSACAKCEMYPDESGKNFQIKSMTGTLPKKKKKGQWIDAALKGGLMGGGRRERGREMKGHSIRQIKNVIPRQMKISLRLQPLGPVKSASHHTLPIVRVIALHNC